MCRTCQNIKGDAISSFATDKVPFMSILRTKAFYKKQTKLKGCSNTNVHKLPCPHAVQHFS